VAGYSNDPIAAQFYPPITTVNVPVEEMVAEACRQLINRSPESRPLRAEFTFENELVIRESTAGITR
jgi:DNA-binding LacI/PurR family transcriptional regulator